MTDVLDKLRELAALKNGEPMPKWLCNDEWNWGDGMRSLLNDAIYEIERLRRTSGEYGPSFRELKHDIMTMEFKRGPSV